MVLSGMEFTFGMGLSWVCVENSVDNTGMFYLLLSSACTDNKPFCLSQCTTIEEAGAQKVER